MWTAFLPLVAGVAALWVRLQRYLSRLRLWEEAAAACGLLVEECSGFWDLGLAIKARKGSLKVRIETSRPRGRVTRLVVEVPEPKHFSEVRIRRKLAGWRRGIEVGDEAFDNTFFIEGPLQLVRALFDAQMRHLLIRVNAEAPLEIARGELRAEVRDELVPKILSLLLEAASRFAHIEHVAQRVVENAHEDPEAGVRLQNLLFLVREHPKKRRTVEALRTACGDPSPQIRLRAARELGAEGHGVLIELAESSVDDTWSAQAVTALGRALPFERASVLLTNALDRRRILTALACVDWLGRSGDSAAIDILVEVLAREEGDLAAAAALALGTTGSPAAEPPLLLTLQREQPDLQVAAANALARVGTTAAVLPLKELAEHTSHHPEIRKAARQAIAEIQSRLPGASPGQLSLAGTEAGQLSLAQTETGQLSLAKDPAGELSLSGEDG